jgi:nitrogen fixation-related uncharacterized protein
LAFRKCVLTLRKEGKKIERNIKEKAADKSQQKWMHLWSMFKEQFSDLPKWAQDILFEDINTAVQNRLKIMKRAQK